MGEKVVVIGGGIAGLTAALELSGTHSVTVLEARERFGGIHTVRNEAGIPFELGAEFVHGKAPELCRLIEAAGLKTHEASFAGERGRCLSRATINCRFKVKYVILFGSGLLAVFDG